MKENILDVLLYLFENCLFENDDDHIPDHQSLVVELSQAGFDQTSIEQAFDWLENLTVLDENISEETLISQDTVRHYTSDELDKLSPKTRGLLMKLEQYGVLDTHSREMVISQLMALGTDTIELDHTKWVILMVLSNYSAGGGLNQFTESLIMNEAQIRIH